MSKPFTYRVEGIEATATETSLLKRFHHDDRKHIRVKSLVPDVDNYDGSGTLTATILFTAPPPAVPRLDDENDDLIVDKDFQGLTPLSAVKGGEAIADIIAVTGLAGHAFGSWATTPDRMWLRDDLPKALNYRARILIYGYKSQIQGPSAGNAILRDLVNTFWMELMQMRRHEGCMNRPLILVGHSLGGLIIKQCIAEEDPVTLSRHHLRGIFFFATPHGGLNIDALQTVVKGQPSHLLIAELERGSPTLRHLTELFRKRMNDAKVQLYTYYESQKTNTVIQMPDGAFVRGGPAQIMVDQTSALLNFNREISIQIDGDHRTMARLKIGRGGIYHHLVQHMKDCLQSGAEMHEAKRQAAILGQSSPQIPESPQVQNRTQDPISTILSKFQDVDGSEQIDHDSERPQEDTWHDVDPSSQSSYAKHLRKDVRHYKPDIVQKFSSQQSDIGFDENLDTGTESIRSGSSSDHKIMRPTSQNPPTDINSSNNNVATGCNMCGASISVDDIYYHCFICKDADGGTYDVCILCEEKKGQCEEGHALMKRRPRPMLQCKSCGVLFSPSDIYYHCVECDGGSYYFCGHCETQGAQCPLQHDLIKRRPTQKPPIIPGRFVSATTSVLSWESHQDREHSSMTNLSDTSTQPRSTKTDQVLIAEQPLPRSARPREEALLSPVSSQRMREDSTNEGLHGTALPLNVLPHSDEDIITLLQTGASRTVGNVEINFTGAPKSNSEDTATDENSVYTRGVYSLPRAAPDHDSDENYKLTTTSSTKDYKSYIEYEKRRLDCCKCDTAINFEKGRVSCIDCYGRAFHERCYMESVHPRDHRCWPLYKAFSLRGLNFPTTEDSGNNSRSLKIGPLPDRMLSFITLFPNGLYSFRFGIQLEPGSFAAYRTWHEANGSRITLNIVVGQVRAANAFVQNETLGRDESATPDALFSTYVRANAQFDGYSSWSVINFDQRVVHFDEGATFGIMITWPGMAEQGIESEHDFILKFSETVLLFFNIKDGARPITPAEFKQSLGGREPNKLDKPDKPSLLKRLFK